MTFRDTCSDRTLFCDGWEFCKTPFGTDYSATLDFRKTDIPHDWLIYDTNALYETSTGWYRKVFNYSKKNGVRTYIRFDGVYMDSAVYVNGEKAGEWKYGYSAFQFDITALIRDGSNTVTVRVDHHAPNSRWYSGAGIYRSVWLCETPEIRFGNDGIYISTERHENSWNVCVTAELLRPVGTGVSGIRIRNTVIDTDGKHVASTESDVCAADISCIPQAARVDGALYSLTTQNISVPSPKLWDIEQPDLYTLVTEVVLNGDLLQRVSQKFGFRTAEFTADRGFFLNGRHVKLHGSCEHHDNGCLGAVSNTAALRRRFTKLRRMGVNAIRTSHNMPSEEFMQLADEMGMLVLSEGFDMWKRCKTEYDYARFFDEWVGKDVSSWIRRDRNHPSVIGWSVGNEIFDTHADDRGQEVTSMLKNLVELHDPRRNGVVTFGSNYMQWENGQKCADILKVVGYNYGERLYPEQHEKHPDWIIYGSETASVVQSRGIYHFPLSQTVLADDDEQCSSLGNSCTGWGAKNTEDCIIKDRDAGYCAGQFIWTGFDYIGEPTPYSTKNSYFGQFDTAGFPKDSAYVFRAEWTDCENDPFVHIFPHWDFNYGQPVDVRVCSNAPRVELFFNGKSMGACDIDHLHGTKLTADYIIPYRKGELRALAYDKNGVVIAEDITRSFGDAAKLVVSADKNAISADGKDLIYLEVSAVDSDGNFCANANNRVNVSVSGAGRLMGLDNGDSTDYDQYKGTSRRLFSGRMLAVIGSSAQTGTITVKFMSPGMPDAVITLDAVDAEFISGTSCSENAVSVPTECGRTDEVPVRKIELCTDNLVISENHPKLCVRVNILPKNADYADDIEYRITNEAGVATPAAAVIANNDGTITVTAAGDGEYCLRAMCRNGTEKYHIMSALPFRAEGLGSALTDPYEFVTAGLYTKCSDGLSQGVSKGIGFPGGNTTAWAAYENVDFGIGSDTVSVYVWANTNDPVRIRFYDGIPDNGGELLGCMTYHEKPEWMVFKPNTIRLDKVLRGIHAFCIETEHFLQINGFVFARRQREFIENNAADAEHIYGDKFSVGENEVTGIGNNVVLDFGMFDFTEEQPARLVIKGRSPLPLNSIHLILDNGNETGRVLCEFRTDGCTEYCERAFPLEGISGKQKVSFAFLPGSNFDMNTFRFEK